MEFPNQAPSSAGGHGFQEAQKLASYFDTFFIANFFSAYTPSVPRFLIPGVGVAPKLGTSPWSGWAFRSIPINIQLLTRSL